LPVVCLPATVHSGEILCGIYFALLRVVEQAAAHRGSSDGATYLWKANA
jgi:hypothetical protein